MRSVMWGIVVGLALGWAAPLGAQAPAEGGTWIQIPLSGSVIEILRDGGEGRERGWMIGAGAVVSGLTDDPTGTSISLQTGPVWRRYRASTGAVRPFRWLAVPLSLSFRKRGGDGTLAPAAGLEGGLGAAWHVTDGIAFVGQAGVGGNLGYRRESRTDLEETVDWLDIHAYTTARIGARFRLGR